MLEHFWKAPFSSSMFGNRLQSYVTCLQGQNFLSVPNSRTCSQVKTDVVRVEVKGVGISQSHT